jgi:hypothetical protein
MTIRSFTLAAAILLAFSAAQAASDDGLKSAIVNCSAEADDAAQLACYNRIAAQLKADAARPPSPVSIATPPQAIVPVAPAARSAAVFGGDSIPFHADASDQPEQMTAGVATVTFNFFHRFTVTLDNGQVWRQEESDTGIARFAKAMPKAVTIKQGMLGSFHLTFQGEWGTFSVKRVK